MGKQPTVKYILSLCLISMIYITTFSQNFLANNSDGNLIALDINGCSTSTVIGIGSYTDIATHPNGFLYAVKSNGQLYQINMMTGNSSLISSFPGSSYYALTSDSDGNIFGASGNGALASYNPNTNTSVTYPNMGYGASGDLTFYQGDMYMATTDNTMVRIDPDNPNNNFVFIDFSSANATIFGIVSAVDGCDVQTYATSNDDSSRIYEIDWDNQAFNFVCTVPHKIYGGSSEFEFNASADFIQISDIDIQADCGDTSADISISASSVNGGLTFSINNEAPQNSGNYSNLPFGNYSVLLTDGNGCTKSENFTVSPPNNIMIDNIVIDDVSCGEMDGSITITASSIDGGIMYSLDGTNFSTNNLFDNIPPADYTIVVTDNSGCTLTTNATIQEITPIELLGINVTNTSCGENNGSLEIETSNNGNTPLFSLDNLGFSTFNSFENLSGGNYTVYIQDENDCLIQEDITVVSSEALTLNNITTSLADCRENNGVISVDAFGGNGVALNYELNGIENTSGVFENLGTGEFQLNISTTEGCEIGPFTTSIGDPCGIYIPNSFSPNQDGYNDVFELYSPSEIHILELSIFDRWGGLIYQDKNYSSTEFYRGWDGKSGNQFVPSGVYVYMFRISKNGTEELLKGDITLLR